MEDGGEAGQGKDAVLIQYLHSWGLREFHDEASYYEWQRSTISPEELRELHRLIEHRHGGDQEADIQFYDFLARPTVLSIFYSQRFDYYLKTPISNRSKSIWSNRSWSLKAWALVSFGPSHDPDQPCQHP